MPRTTAAVPDPRLPEHAIAELDDPALAAFWRRWLDVADAKDAGHAAFDDLVAAQKRYRDCRGGLARRTPNRGLPPGACSCGKCGPALTTAVELLNVARSRIEPAEQAFKDG